MKVEIAKAAPVVSRIGRGVGLAREAGWLLGFVIVVLGSQTALFLALFGGAIHLAAYVAIQVLGSLVLATLLVLRLRSSFVDERSFLALQIVVWSALAGPFGALVAMALALPKSQIKLPTDDGRDDSKTDRAANEQVERAHIALLDRRVRLEGAARIRPLMDVMMEGSRANRLEALRVVYRRYEAGLGAVLRRALQDSDASVRVLAATVIANLHATYSRSIGNCQLEAGANPRLVQKWRMLAEARLAYAQSGLLEPSRARAQIEFAIGDLSRAAELDAGDAASAALLASARRRLTARRE